jgi:hypothetical protein
MRVACSTEKVVIWEYTVQKRMHVDQMGSSFTTIFTSSTSVTVDAAGACFSAGADRSDSTIAALSRHLKKRSTDHVKTNTTRLQFTCNVKCMTYS